MIIDSSDMIAFKPLQCGVCGVELRSREKYEVHYDACKRRSDEVRARLIQFRLNGPSERADASSMGINAIREHLAKIPKKRG